MTNVLSTFTFTLRDGYRYRVTVPHGNDVLVTHSDFNIVAFSAYSEDHRNLVRASWDDYPPAAEPTKLVSIQAPTEQFAFVEFYANRPGAVSQVQVDSTPRGNHLYQVEELRRNRHGAVISRRLLYPRE